MNRRFVAASLAVLLCGSVLAVFGASDTKSIHWFDTGGFKHVDASGRYRKSQEMVRHLRNEKRFETAGVVGSTESIDVGDVAVVVDKNRIFTPPRPANPFDLAEPSGLRFDPGSSTDSWAVSVTSTIIDATMGPDIGLGDDEARRVETVDSATFNGGTGFPFLGTRYTTDQIFMGSDGHVTFGAPDDAVSARDAARLIGGPPRIAPFFADLDPSGPGGVHVDIRTDRIVVTWSGVPEYGATSPNTFQTVLWANGVIDFAYETVAAQYGVVGIAAGNDSGPINEIDLSAELPVTRQAGAIFEEFAPAVVVQQVDVIEAAQEFYRTHPDKYDFLVMFTDEPVDLGGGAFAYNLTLHNTTEGLGLYYSGDVTARYDFCSVAGLPDGCEMESILNMNNINLYWPDEEKLVDPPIRKFPFFCLNATGQFVRCSATLDGPPGADQISRRARWFGTDDGAFGYHGIYTLGLNSAMSLMGQEAGHRWLAFPAINHPVTGVGADSTDLLGRSLAHWSWFFNVPVPAAQFGGDPRASSAQGNVIEDLGASSLCINPGERLFLTARNELIDGYTELDQYFMGVRPPGEVSPFWYIDRPTRPRSGVPFPAAQALAAAQDDRLICGRRVDLTLQNITDVGDVVLPDLDSNGTRDPLIGDEQDGGPGITAADDAACATGRTCVDVKTTAFILLVKDMSPNTQTHATAIQTVDNFRRAWEQYANGPAIGGRGARGSLGAGNYIKKFDTSLTPVIH